MMNFDVNELSSSSAVLSNAEADLSERDKKIIVKAYHQVGHIRTVDGIVELLKKLGQFEARSELAARVTEIGYREGFTVPLELIYELMRDRKKEHQYVTKGSDLIGAFVSLGGHANQAGQCDISPLLGVIHQFCSHDEIMELVEENCECCEGGKTVSMDFSQFSILFQHINQLFSPSINSQYGGIEPGTPKVQETVKRASSLTRSSRSASSASINKPRSPNKERRLGSIATHLQDRASVNQSQSMAELTPRTKSVLDGTYPSLKIMNHKGEITPVTKGPPPTSRAKAPTMVEREEFRVERIMNQYKEQIDHKINSTFDEERRKSVKYRPPTDYSKLKLFKSTRPRTSVQNYQSDPKVQRDLQRAEDEFVRSIALLAQQGKKQVVQTKAAAKRRAQFFQERRAHSSMGKPVEEMAKPPRKQRTFHLTVLSDYTEPKTLRCAASTYVELVAAVASVVLPLPKDHFVSDVWYCDEAQSFLPVTKLEEVPSKAIVRALIFSPVGSIPKQEEGKPTSGAMHFPKMVIPQRAAEPNEE